MLLLILIIIVNPVSVNTTAHMKSYLKYRRVVGGDSTTMLDYLLIGSHNLSMAAWGLLENNKTQL